MVRVAVTGASGRMGKLIIYNIVNAENMELSAAFDLINIGKDAGIGIECGNLDIPISDINDLQHVLKESRTDVLIDFTIASATIINAPKVAASGVNLIIGTTGLSKEEKNIIEDSILKNNIAGIISPNFSVGVNVFFKILSQASHYLQEYDIEIIEAHHNKKKDAPSGTAIKAADIISNSLGGKEYIYGRNGLSPRGKEIGIHAVRGGDIVGDHTVMFVADGERIEIKHQAHSRQTFAVGAVKAAAWICSVKPGLYTMEDFLGL